MLNGGTEVSTQCNRSREGGLTLKQSGNIAEENNITQ